ncbi:hypothetical protein PC129_g22887 [Phytophthora cactorum]|uniref:Uncharacterized protein n=1 Tax=Phytophthora cactorum TaxID=29920 RepID=A0A329RB86_9STRA|nr:hypothetical protein PC111_g21599 [Phytophthora cactorum]KAG2797078.1 hypothetical protein PC112_g21938 [Phytophthora cactorum]KAG2887541.1 hypothetical protein PC114_g18800 [Phytophthora cactorum]KAG2899620.1 hypothetical protein PC115_g16467 [Phytophthora cactorum]KAG2914826.1 hypothetical protein PC117_g18205 [Phytophthora cactorum]
MSTQMILIAPMMPLQREDASSNDSDHEKEDNDNSCFNDFAFEYEGDDGSVRDSAIV